MQACTRGRSGALRAIAAAAWGLLASSQLVFDGGCRRPTRDPHHPRQLAASSWMLELAATGAAAGAGPVDAAGSDEGLESFSSSPVWQFLRLHLIVGHSLLCRLHRVHQLPPTAASAGATSL